MKKHDLCVEYDKKAHSSSINLTVGFIYASTLHCSDCLYSYLHLLINKLVRFIAILALGMLTVNPAWAASAIQPQVRDFIEGMVERYAFDRRELEAAFGQVNILPDALKLISAPSSPISWN